MGIRLPGWQHRGREGAPTGTPAVHHILRIAISVRGEQEATRGSGRSEACLIHAWVPAILCTLSCVFCLIVPAGYRSSLSLGDVIQTYTSTVLQLGKIGGRLRRQAICLLAVVLDPTGEDAPALTKLLEQLPQVEC